MFNSAPEWNHDVTNAARRLTVNVCLLCNPSKHKSCYTNLAAAAVVVVILTRVLKPALVVSLCCYVMYFAVSLCILVSYCLITSRNGVRVIYQRNQGLK